MNDDSEFVDSYLLSLEKTAFSLVKSRLALGSPGWLFVCHQAKNGLIHKMAVDCPIVITSIGGTYPFQTRPDQE